MRATAIDRRDVSLVDELGASTVEVTRAKLLCAPVNKNDEDSTAPDELDHLVGYEIHHAIPAFGDVRHEVVVDQFGRSRSISSGPSGLTC